MARASDLGDGDPCPLVPRHGNMFVLPGKVPKQYCPHVMHDGHGEVARSRSVWPLYGLEDTLTTYLARLGQAVAKAELPDLSSITLEV